MDPQEKHYVDKLSYEMDSWDLQAARGAGELALAIDARSREAYAAEHIPHAINLPHREASLETTRLIDRDALLVVYCDGIGCNASTKGALTLHRLGFRVRELVGGLDWWKRDGHPTEGRASNPATDPSAENLSGGCGCG